MTGDEVVIAGRTFRLGTVYAPRPRMGRGGRKPRQLLDYDAESLLRAGRVTLAIVPSGNLRVMTGEAWAAWAGEEIRP